MCTLDATDEQLDVPTVYGSSKKGWMGAAWKTPTDDITYLLDTIIEQIIPPKDNPGTLQLRISSLDYSSFTGRIAVGRVHRGSIKMGDRVSIIHRDRQITKSTVKELFTFEGLGKRKLKKK